MTDRKTFIEMYNEGWCNSCDRLDTGECSKSGFCYAYEHALSQTELDKNIKKEAKDGKESV